MCITVNLYDIWADDGWYGGFVEIFDASGNSVQTMTQGADVAANTADRHTFCAPCGGCYDAELTRGGYGYGLSYDFRDADGALIASASGADDHASDGAANFCLETENGRKNVKSAPYRPILSANRRRQRPTRV